MDIEILLLLQNFRNGIGAILLDFMLKATYLGDMNVVMVLMAMIYWSFSKKLGTYLLMGWNGNRLMNGALKVTACVYRPYTRDARVIPDTGSMNGATGYSFPSGHSMNAATVYGGGAIRKDFPMILRVILFAITLIIGFSRMFLGVHTPQDVLIGIIAGLLVMWLTHRLLIWIEDNPEKDRLVVVIGLILAILLAAYAYFKPYPVDYDAQGNLIVDGAKMAVDTFKGIGWCSGFLIGWLLERRYVNFSTDVKPIEKLSRLVIGIFSYYMVSLILVPLIKILIPGPVGTTLSCFFQMLYIIFIVPFFIVRLEKKIIRTDNTDSIFE